MAKKTPNHNLPDNRLEAVNLIYEMVSDASVFPKLTDSVFSLANEEQQIPSILTALENSANLAQKFSTMPDVDISRDIGLLVLGLNLDDKVSHTPPNAEQWKGAKFIGNKKGIGWLDTKDDARNIASVLSLDKQNYLPIHQNLKEGLKAKSIARLIVVHQFILSGTAIDALEQLYSLTPAEIRLCQYLAAGKTLKETAHELGVTIEGPRTQLKNIFAKIGVRRQPELIRILTQISAAAAIHEYSHTNNINLEPDWKNGLISVQTIFCNTRYGTKLAYSMFGDPKGKPVLYFHHALGSRLHSRSMAEDAKENGLLIYKFDRPGYGHSSPIPNYSSKILADCTKDFLKHINIQSIDALTYAIGTRVALDALPYLDQRIKSLTVYSPEINVQAIIANNSFWKKLTNRNIITPKLVISLLRILKVNLSDKAIRRNLQHYYQDSKADLHTLANQNYMMDMLTENKLSTRQNFAGTKIDYDLVTMPFTMSAAQTYEPPIIFIFGSDDPINTYKNNVELINMIPNCHVYESKGHGQLHIYSAFGQFLKSAFEPENCDWITEIT